MRKIKHLFLALLAVTGLSTAWASNLPGTNTLPSSDNGPAKTSFSVQWSGETTVTYNGQQQTGLTATYVDGDNVTHTLALSFTDGTTVINSPNYPVNAGAWIVTAQASGVTLDGATNVLNIQPAPVYVTGASAEIAKFADGTFNGVVTNHGTLNGVFNNDNVDVLTTAIFSDSTVGTGDTITLYYALVGDVNTLSNYTVTPSSAFYTDAGVVLPNVVPNNSIGQHGFDLSAYGYCTGNGYSIDYHLSSGNPDQFRIDFADTRIADITWTDLATTGANGTIAVNLPAANLPTGNYAMSVYFRDSRYPALESQPVTLNIHVNLPETYTMPLFDNVIALVDTCHCFSNIQWYHRGSAAEAWTAIPGATGYYYREEGGLTGEYFVQADMNGVTTYTCPQTDLSTLIADEGTQTTVAAYPNPAVETVQVTIKGSEASTHTLRVINTMGAELESLTFEGESTNLDLRHYQHGSYMVNVDGLTVRIIKK